MTSIEIMALIVAVLAAIKLLVILINPKSWMAVVKAVYGNPAATTIISLILAGLALKYLLVELTIVQIFAVMLFFMFLMAIGFSAYSKDALTWANRLLADRNAMKKSLLPILIWLVLVVWVFYALFV